MNVAECSIQDAHDTDRKLMTFLVSPSTQQTIDKRSLFRPRTKVSTNSSPSLTIPLFPGKFSAPCGDPDPRFGNRERRFVFPLESVWTSVVSTYR
jgi:hypothetical protein